MHFGSVGVSWQNNGKSVILEVFLVLRKKNVFDLQKSSLHVSVMESRMFWFSTTCMTATVTDCDVEVTLDLLLLLAVRKIVALVLPKIPI